GTLPMWLAILLTLAAGTLFGIWHGVAVTKLNIPPFIITLGTYLIARGSASYLTKGYPVVFDRGDPFLELGQGRVGFVPTPFIILIVMAVIAYIILTFTKLGYRIYAVGGNLEAARLSGINVTLIRILCYAISGFLAAVTGILLASRLGQGTPTVG